MKRSTYLHGRAAGIFYDSTELLAQAILRRRIPDDILIDKDVVYGDGPREKLNFIYPKETKVKRPLLIYIHGGGFISGHKNMRNYYCTEYVKNGYIAANIDYEIAPRKVFPFQLKQCFKAIDHILDNADKYGIDTSRIVLAGESAGAFFIFYVAAAANDHSVLDKLGIDFKHKDEFKPRAVVSICGAVDMGRLVHCKFPDIKVMVKCFTDRSVKEINDGKDTEEIKILSPQPDEKFPPAMIIYAHNDALKPESLAIVNQLNALGVPTSTFEGTGLISFHAFPIATICKQGRECLNRTLGFIKPYVEQ